MVDKKEDKKLRLDSLYQNKKSAEHEVEMLGEAVVKQKDFLAMQIEQRDLKERMHEIAMEQFELLDVSWKFMADPEYHEARKKLSALEWKMTKQQLDAQIRDAEQRVLNFEEQIESQKQNALKTAEEIAELEK